MHIATIAEAFIRASARVATVRLKPLQCAKANTGWNQELHKSHTHVRHYTITVFVDCLTRHVPIATSSCVRSTEASSTFQKAQILWQAHRKMSPCRKWWGFCNRFRSFMRRESYRSVAEISVNRSRIKFLIEFIGCSYARCLTRSFFKQKNRTLWRRWSHIKILRQMHRCAFWTGDSPVGSDFRSVTTCDGRTPGEHEVYRSQSHELTITVVSSMALKSLGKFIISYRGKQGSRVIGRSVLCLVFLFLRST